MQEIQKEKIYCLLLCSVHTGYFEYAKQACDLGAFAYLLKPINDDELRQIMCGAYESCMGQIQNEEKLERWEDSDGQGQRYISKGDTSKICKKQSLDRKGGTSVSNVRYNFREE